MLTDEVLDELEDTARTQVILQGIETHVCVQQTCLELLSLNYDVHILADAVSSSRAYERKIALKRMRSVGAMLTTTESMIFELCHQGDDPAFKACLELVK